MSYLAQLRADPEKYRKKLTLYIHPLLLMARIGSLLEKEMEKAVEGPHTTPCRQLYTLGSVSWVS